MNLLKIFFSILGVAILITAIWIGQKINRNYNTKIYKSAPLIKHDPNRVFEFKTSTAGWEDYIGNSKKLNSHRNGKDYSNLTFNEFLEKETKTSAFIVIRKDSILYEQYFDGYEPSTYFPSYSISKSFVSALLGILIEEGAIDSIHDPVTKYIKELEGRGSYWDILTIENVLNMSSGLKFIETDPVKFPYFGLANLYLSNNAMRTIKKAKFIAKPGLKYKYNSLDNQILGIVIERATGKGLDQLLEEKIWTKIGMQADARWSYDSKKHKNIRSYCCLKGNVLDYARLGRLYLNRGRLNGEQIVPERWVQNSANYYSRQHYPYNWFFDRYRAFYSEGYYGQFLYINPHTETIFIRLGKKADLESIEVFRAIERMLDDKA